MLRFTRINRPTNPSRKTRPVVENLEGRQLMYATTGDHFTYGNGIRFSIVPDGTSVNGQTSNLYATFDKLYGANVWEHYIFDAAAMWESNANINLFWTADNGDPIGSGTLQQGNAYYGDIRIGGYVQASNIMAYTILPPPANGDSSSGDIFINTSLPWGGQYGYDFETTMVHEFGHALGMAHSTDTNATMYSFYTGVKEAPNADDTAGIQSIWGPRPEDFLQQAYGNQNAAHAANLTPYINTQNNQIAINGLDVQNSGESYWFKVVTPANANPNLVVVVQSQYLSLLSPRVQIYDASGTNGLAQTSASIWSYGSFTQTYINNATPNTTYYIRVLASYAGPNGSGAYALFVNMGSGTLVAFGPAATAVSVQPNQGSGSWNETTSAATRKKAQLDPGDFIKIGSTLEPVDKLMISPALLRRQKTLIAVQTKQTHPTARLHAKHLVAASKKPQSVLS